MRAFIIRPFGEKQGIDFDSVEAKLIKPVLRRLDLAGGTTGEVIEAGNIREDMFQLLLVSDLVVADISIDNANAYYELGIRHALRQRRTFLIRARGASGDVPFDLRTDRYLAYDPAHPEESVDALYDGLKATIASERQDSPVFRLLPELREQPRSTFLPVPREFREDVEQAARTKDLGKLALLAHEVEGALWMSEGLRLVGLEQFRAKGFDGAILTLEALRATDPIDQEANLLLGTLYQRVGDLAKSEVALRRVAGNPDASAKDRAEVLSLLGRNLKTQWRDSWRELPIEARRRRALRSPLLGQSYDAYLKGFRQDLNHFYSGLNALALLTIQLELAGGLPEIWSDRFASEEEAQRARAQLVTQKRLLSGAVEFSLQASRQYLEQAGQTDPWVEVSLADFLLLTSDRPGTVAHAYEAALETQPAFVSDAVRGQLRLYEELGLLSGIVSRVFEVLAPEEQEPASAAPPHVVLFTGHQVDAPRRPRPRFPPEKVPLAEAAIRAEVEQVLAAHRSAVGFAGAASGGDILFHEVCAELGVPTRLYLALPPEAYAVASVAPAGGDWVARFYKIASRFPTAPILSRTHDLPGWLRHRRPYSIWQRNNLWVLNEALASSGGAGNLTLIALWNGEKGDGPGGTADMIRVARERGAAVRILDSNDIFGLSKAAPEAEA